MLEIVTTLHEETLSTLHALDKNHVERQLAFPKADNIIKVAIGMRRTGKTYFLYQTMKALLASGVTPQQILMIDFEDDRLLPMSSKQMGECLDAFYTLYPENHERCCYLFLDEVQNIPDWHVVVRRYFESKQVKLYLTGSSAKLLSKEIATSLRGRSLSINIWPYSFNEYLVAHTIQKPNKPYGRKSLDILQQHLLDYFTTGGFPAVQSMPMNEWRDSLQNYVDTVILRDIVERHNVSNISLLKYLTSTLLKNAATVFSVNKFYNDIKSQGHKIGKDTLYTYMDYLEDAFLIFTVPYYCESARITQNTPKKIYAIDTGVINATTLGTNKMLGKLFENLIYLDLRRQNKEVYYYHTRDGFEVDFVAVDKNGTRELIQVALDMHSPHTAQREQRALKQAEQTLGITGKIITPHDYLRDI